MAWEDFDRYGRQGMTGDKPIDELALTLARIAAAYESRFDRKPTIDEVIHALEIVVDADPASYISDSVKPGTIKVTRTG